MQPQRRVLRVIGWIGVGLIQAFLVPVRWVKATARAVKKKNA